MTTKALPFVTKVDLYLMVLLLLLSSIIRLSFREPSDSTEKYLKIRVFGKPSREMKIPLNHPKKVGIQGILGTSTIECDRAGRVRISFSPCPNQICTTTGWVKSPFGVCCVPNGVVVECVPDDKEFDGFSR